MVGLSIFQIEQGDISSLKPRWDFWTDLHIVALLVQHIDSRGLGKCKDMDLDSSSTLSMLLCIETPFNEGVVPISPSIRHFPISCFVFKCPNNSRESFVCLDNALSSCFFLFYEIMSLHWELVLHFDGQDCESVKPPNHLPMPIFCKQDWQNWRIHIQTHSSSFCHVKSWI